MALYLHSVTGAPKEEARRVICAAVLHKYGPAALADLDEPAPKANIKATLRTIRKGPKAALDGLVDDFLANTGRQDSPTSEEELDSIWERLQDG